MQTNRTITKNLQRRILAFYGVALAIVLMGNEVTSITPSSADPRNHVCSIPDKAAEKGFNVNEILFSIKSFSLYDMSNN
jgi:hypothetical protein